MFIVRFIKNWILPLIIGTAVAITVQHYFGVGEVSGESMAPTLYNGERLIIQKESSIKRFSIVIFNAKDVDPKDTSGDDYIKRVIGLPGDRISYHANGDIDINNKTYHQPFIAKDQQTTGTLQMEGDHNYNDGFNLPDLSRSEAWPHPMTEETIPANEYFVMGDNRSVSNDSRYWGFVPKNKIIGVTTYTVLFQKIDGDWTKTQEAN